MIFEGLLKEGKA